MKKIGVVFVHGFMGGLKTWENESGVKFCDLLKSNPGINSKYDFFEFDYFTKVNAIFESAPVQRFLGLFDLVKKIGFNPKIKSNRPIKQLSELLSSYIRGNLNNHDEVIVVAHSMGGLIAKDYILNYVKNNGPKPSGYVSIAVPHKGTFSAALLPSGVNVNLNEMMPLSEYGDRINSDWQERKEYLPPSIYLVAIHDECVLPTSAIPYKIKDSEKFIVDHDHLSVCKPSDVNDLSYKFVEKFLISLAPEISQAPLNSSDFDYNKEIFVIKPIIGSVNEMGMEDAKESFFQAEIVSKAANQEDKKTLAELQIKVLSLYRLSYVENVSKNCTANQIFTEVHKILLEQDGKVLDVAVRHINFLHKKGLLHQVANRLNRDVIWSSDTTLEEIMGKI